ncbi:MAG: adenosylmethionine decarboxylase [Patescibacteria group bacterium]|jgi:S-adenosylmethionine decarboxylase
MRRNKPIGFHIIVDCFECDFSKLRDISMGEIKKIISGIIDEAGLCEQGNFYKYFGPGAMSGIVSLAESHVSFHTWPEIGYVSMDIFVCNYRKDNSSAAESVSKNIINLCRPGRIKKRVIYR